MLVGLLMFAFQIKLPHIVDNTLATVGYDWPGCHVGGGYAAGLFAVAFDCVDTEALSRCFFLRLILIPVLLLFAVKACGFAHHDAHADTVVLISFFGNDFACRFDSYPNGGCLR